MTTIQEKIAVMQAFADGKRIESRVISLTKSLTWYHISSPSWDWSEKEYRIAPAKKSSINWDHVHPDFKYMAMDSRGNEFLSDGELILEPYLYGGCWKSDECTNFVSASRFSSYVKGDVDWKDSLQKRPE